MKPINSIAKNVSLLVFSVGILNCLTAQVKAATFHADISNLKFVMPAVITNAFGFALSTGVTSGGSGSSRNAGATFSEFTIQQKYQPSGLLPPFSPNRLGSTVTGGSVDGFANPVGISLAQSQAALFGRLGNGTVLAGNPQNIPLTFDLSFDYNLTAAANLLLESASAAYEVKVTGLGNPDANCAPLSLSIVANDARAGSVTCTFSTTLTAGEFRDFDIQVKVGGEARANQNPPPPPNIPVELPKDLVRVPEPTSTLSLLALGTLGAASTLKRKLKSSKPSEKETTKVS
jgi:hypothetical protein